ncbi:FER1L6 [Symbiodinium sp. CCMP2456]|nr:FER1L6 [Symbiodinium sp. CCMP2456]
MKSGKIQHCKFDESYIWNDFYITETEFNMACIEFELQAANIFTRNTVLGTGKVQLAMVRQRPNHTYVRKQIQLTLEHKLTSKLTVTVFCYGEGDKPPAPDDAQDNKEEVEAHLNDLTAAVIGDTGNKNQFNQFYHLFVQVHRAEHLGGGEKTYNPYVSVEFNGHELRSPAARETHTLAFDEQFRIPVTTPLFQDSIVIRIWDSSKWMGDEIIVQGRLSFSLLRMHALSPKWFNFYGFKSEEVPDVQAITSSGDIAEENAYLGRLLISARVNKVESMSALQLPAVLRGGPCEEPPSKVENFLMDVFEVSGCAGSEVMLEMTIGVKSKKTKTALRSKESDEDPTTPGRFTFQGDKGRMTPLVAVIPTNPPEQLDVILSLYSRITGYVSNADWQRIGFSRIKVAEVRDWDGDTQTPLWCTMNSMAHLPSSVEPGSILCSLAKSQETVLTRGVPNCKPVKFHLRCYISMARNLQCEGNRVPSAFCEISCAGQRERTAVIPQTSSPNWSDMLALDISLQCSLQNMRCYPEPVQLTVYDVVGKSLMDKVADAATSAKQLANSAMAGQLGNNKEGKLNFNDEAGQSGLADMDFAKLGDEYKEYVKDQALATMMGDVMAAKRLGEVKGGRRVIGRQKINFRKLLHPLANYKMRQRWLRLKGGVMATGWAGDIMIGLEMMRAKYVSDFPQKIMKPPGKPCLVSVSIIGLRNITLGDQLQGEPVLEIVVPSVKPDPSKPQPKASPKALAAPEGKGKGKGKEGKGKEGKGKEGKGKGKGKKGQVPEAEVVAEVKEEEKPSKAKEGKDKEKEKTAPGMEGLATAEGSDAIQEKSEWVQYQKKPNTRLHDKDTNKKWTASGRTGYEFLNVVHLGALLPKLPVYEPDIRFRLRDSAVATSLLAEGRIGLAEHLPWVTDPEKAKKSTEARDKYSDSEDGDRNDGMPVSDCDDEGSNYVEVVLGNQPAKIAFNKDDKTSFPPVITACSEKGPVAAKGIGVGDWLIAVKKKEEKQEQTVTWNPAQANEFIETTDKEKIRPLKLVFRRKDRMEIQVRLLQGPHNLELANSKDEMPPKIMKDNSKDKMWRKQGISPGFRIVDINGVDTKEMTAVMPRFKQLLQLRPAIISCRPHGLAARGDSDRAIQEVKDVMLSGVASEVFKEYEHKLRHKDGPLAFMRVPRPSAVIPDPVNTQHLNCRPARAACLDVQGLAKFIAGGDEDDDKARPSVQGCLEHNMNPAVFRNIPLLSGATEIGQVKARFKVVSPPNKKWMYGKEGTGEDKVFFNEKMLRKRFKIDQPHSLRVRTYIIRGLNVSGAVSGYGNPYLYFMYGASKVSLEGHRQMQSVEPRYFRTEECDINLPEQSYFEIGLFDYQENGEDLLIGKSVLDLEDRFYTRDYMIMMKNKKVPIEYRPLICESIDANTGDVSTISKGSLEMWIELLDTTTAAEIPVSKLLQPPAMEVEVRLICWTVHDLQMRMCTDEYGDPRESISIRCRCSIDCRTYNGPQPKEQETDQHDSCVGDGEFNWRFLFSRIQVTKGVPIDCFLHLSVWEYFALSRPIMLCESLLELKSYVKKVSEDRMMLEMEADLPLSNNQLQAELKKELKGEGGVEGGGDGDEDEPAAEEEEDAEGDGELNAGAVEEERAIPPAAYMKIVFQVLAQTEASNENNKVGIARNEPNRNPSLPFPKTGRDWRYSMPTAASVVEKVMDAFSPSKRGPLMTLIMFFIIASIISNVPFDEDLQCVTTVKQSCFDQSTCFLCNCCGRIGGDMSDAKKQKLCKWGFIFMSRTVDEVCTNLADCNLAQGATCSADAEGNALTTCTAPYAACSFVAPTATR